MIPRVLAKKLLQSAKKFPVVAVTGPRQSGKTTLVRRLFAQKPYVSLEDLDTRDFAKNDPRGFLSEYSKGAVLDEIQRVPELFSYLQTLVDEKKKAGLFILTGSSQFLLMENLSQTLAGRVHILNLLPLSLEELRVFKAKPATAETAILRGMYPRLYDKRIAASDWYPDYLRTYIERDVRLIKNISDLSQFQKFLKLCAGRSAQLLNLSSIADECGMKHNTAKAWIGILEASFVVYLLKPHHRNFNKRVVKIPKLYFYDTGLACSLLEIETERQLKTHPLKGQLFETLILGELIKYRLNRGLPANLYFWRDKTGHEIDCVIDQAGKLIPIEVKFGKTVTQDFFRNLNYWRDISKQKKTPAFLLYGGEQNQRRGMVSIINWQNPDSLFAHLK